MDCVQPFSDLSNCFNTTSYYEIISNTLPLGHHHQREKTVKAPEIQSRRSLSDMTHHSVHTSHLPVCPSQNHLEQFSVRSFNGCIVLHYFLLFSRITRTFVPNSNESYKTSWLNEPSWSTFLLWDIVAVSHREPTHR